MALIDITPKMTSNTTPEPYVVSASSMWNATFEAWKAFNGTVVDIYDGWSSARNIITGWLKIDFGSAKRIDAFSVTSRNIDDMTITPKNFILYGSNDDISYEKIYEANNEILWHTKELRLFKLQNYVSYRYYKITFSANNGNISYTGVGYIKFWQDDDIVSYISNRNASLHYCLSKNTTDNIMSRQNDEREGLLGFANDFDNYGTLYMINNRGRAIIPISSTKQELIFSGNASTTGIYSTSKTFNTYKSINITANIVSSSVTSLTTITIPVDDFLLSTSSSSYRISIPSNATNIGYIDIYYVSENTFNITVTLGDFTSIAITKIYGIY